MSDNDKFNECLDCPGCSCDCGQGCGSCQENFQAPKTQESLETSVELTVETSSENTAPTGQQSPVEESIEEKSAVEKPEDAQQECPKVEINPMDTDQVAHKTEDLLPKVDPSRGKLDCFNYLADIPGGKADYDIVEVQFKNTRKGFYRNTSNLDLKLGDMVAVESQPGHDIGRVTLVGHLVRNQMRKAGLSEDSEIRKIFRFARESDMEKYYEAKALEIPTMIGSRQIAAELGLKMKIGDVEYQGDGLKAIFYYIADERVDFRQLIKILAERFKIRVEMRQIGARQEAGRIGGIGPCGRPLCCSTWMTNFVTVATSAARHQDLSLNPQKLAGQCAKLKCCLNFEIDTYLESVKKMPPKETRLETLEASWYHFKTDIFKGEITYSSDKKNAVNTVTITAERAFEIIDMNNRGEKPLSLIPDEEAKSKAQGSYNDILGDDSQIGRFDKKKKKKKKKKDKDAAANGTAGTTANDSSEDLLGESTEENSVGANANNTDVNNTNANPAAAKAKAEPKDKNRDNAGTEATLHKEALENGNVETKETAESAEQAASVPKTVQPASGNLSEETPVKEEVTEAVSEPTSEPTVEHTSKAKPESVEKANEVVEVSGQVEESHDNDTVVKSDTVKEETASYSALEGEVEAENDSEVHPHHQNHHHHHHNPHGNSQETRGENIGEAALTGEPSQKGNNPNYPNKPQRPGKNQGKGFKPQQGKGPDQQKNREPGKGPKPEQGKESVQNQQGQAQGGQPQHQHGQHKGQHPQGKDQFKPNGQNTQPDRRNSQDNPNSNKGFKPQRQGNSRDGQPTHPNQSQGQNGPREEYQNQGQNNKKKKNKKSFNGGENAGNPNPQQGHGAQGRPHHQGHQNPNRPSQNQGARNQNPGSGNPGRDGGGE